jgi:uncharacterized RDD family membrane protein YckC
MGYSVPQKPPWKGARYGRPAQGPGSLASQWRRLGARLLDSLVLSPILIGLIIAVVVLIAPHAGPIFPNVSSDPNQSTPGRVPGILWIELGVFGATFVFYILLIFYDAVMTVRYGHTLGKKWLQIRPIRTDGSPLRFGRSIGRAAGYYVMSGISILGLLDILWCLWDEDQQCLHDKMVGTLVIND